jgi:outer membrane protein OmpA-like peptidoglycan-associated protein
LLPGRIELAERFMEIDMNKYWVRICLAFALMTAAFGNNPVKAQDFLNQDWLLNPGLSNVYMQSVKKNAIFETHKFNSVEGNIGKDGTAEVRIDLASIDSGVDIRDVRMRFLLFETYKFPTATISAKLDKAKLQALATKTRIRYPLNLKLNMHGFDLDIETAVWVTRLSDSTVSVASIKPIIITAKSLGLGKNIGKLMEAVGGIPIASGSAVTFDLVFGTGALKQELAAAREVRQKQKVIEATKTISAEACETRLTVISEKSAIYFDSGSADIDRESEPVLDAVVEFANRCPSVKFNVSGHTDDIGGNRRNQRLSERRARSVVNYLTKKGVGAGRIQSAGYGDSQPVVPNNSDANRAKNRRIEFKVNKS